jgi:hypothetical protein
LHTRYVRIGEAATITRALANRSDLDLLETALQVLHCQLVRVRRTVAVDLQPPVPQLDLFRNTGEMVGTKKTSFAVIGEEK